MRVLITGGTGMIGRALATNLLQDNGKNEVIVLSRNPERIRKPQPGVQYLGWDGRTAQGGVIPLKTSTPSSTWRVNPLRQDAGPQRGVNASGIAVLTRGAL